MYTVIGVRPDGSECEPLEYETVEEAMKKLQDLIEADEWDLDSDLDQQIMSGGLVKQAWQPMFVRYIVVPHQAPHEPRGPNMDDDWKEIFEAFGPDMPLPPTPPTPPPAPPER